MSSVKEYLQHKNQEKVYKNNIISLYPRFHSKRVKKKTNIFKLMKEIQVEKNMLARHNFKIFFISSILVASLVLFYFFY